MNAPITENTTRPPLAEAQQTQLFTDALAELAAGLGLVPAAVSGSTKRRGLVRVSALTAAVDDAMAQMPDVVEKIKGGKVQAVGALIGPVMKATRGQADAGRVRQIILEKLGVQG